MGFDAKAIDVRFIPGIFNIEQIGERVRAEAEALGGLALVIINTLAAYFLGDGENNNVQMGEHARQLCALTTLPGWPTVLTNCHPVKNATAGNLVPRGGGAFLAEVDGNLTCAKAGSTTTLLGRGSFAGPSSSP